ncbi:MAG TPA: glycoside hydrolase family 25 protein [Phenylobacterium sp.]|jgi:GH25 family lysozyme M1 (1,4-beta-N-acetylmuramidase)|uniref:glycoside hydrolase family 25 protein n=1 Tax=Phenylobacterium sp. TaxID=1871053 RepID=UPI002D4514A9|nr:glycoside hydrolase family 25 protein [Phenylobacterium sp.]HZZ66647.1 glycoside hydrolase family 25 protein [Phenylobacterium sp.]
MADTNPVPGPFPGLDDTPRVIDLSHNDAVTSFATAKAAGLAGVIHKATTGGTGSDPQYAARRQAATDAGLLWGAYHWGTAAPVAQQVANFLAVAQPNAQTLVALDYEATPGDQMTLDLARGFSDGVFAALGRRPVIYGGILLKTDLGATVDAFFGSHRLWLAQYGPAPAVQASWQTFWLWQYTDGTSGPGCQAVTGVPGNAAGDLDCDYFQGATADLTAQWAS